jgi:DNA adenine methylase
MMQTLLFPQELDVTLSPPLKWAGGKRWLVPTLTKLWKPYSERRLIEPFVGGMAVTLGLQPKEALLNDVNEHLINFYLWLQRGLKVNKKLANDETIYYQYRERFNSLVTSGKLNSKESREVAELFYYLNRTCFNGLCRFNSKGEFNVPFGSYKTINYTLDFSAYVDVLKNWEIQQGDFRKIVVKPNDFVYADPPYDVKFTTYSAGGFSWKDQEELANWLASLKVPTVVSNQATDRVVSLYKELGFSIEVVKAPRRISCNGDRTPADEMLALKGV